MRYIFLAGSIIFGITGISQAMDALMADGVSLLAANKLVYDFQYVTVSFTPFPGFARILILSLGLFVMYLVWRKLKELGIGRLTEYILE